MAQDYYATLGVQKGDDADTIKKAYRKLAMKYHPDQNKGNEKAEAKFKEISQAYDILKDDQKRAAYDQYGHAAFDGSMGAGPGAGGGFGGFSSSDFSGFGGAFSDIFEDMFGNMGMGGGQQGSANRGSDVQYTLDITLDEAFHGKDQTLTIPLPVTCESCNGTGSEGGAAPEVCPSCQGTGRMRMQQGFFTIEKTCTTCRGTGNIIRDPCKTCAGAGRYQKDKTLKVNIPQGIDHGRRIRLTGEGEAGVRGGSSGDLYILISIRPHKLFQRDGANLYCRVPIPMTTAALGGEIEVPTISGTLSRVKIPPGTQTGQQLRLKEQGMSVMRSSARGDMFLEIFVETPMNLSRKQQDIFKKLEEAIGGKESKKHSPESSGFLSKVKELWSDLTE